MAAAAAAMTTMTTTTPRGGLCRRLPRSSSRLLLHPTLISSTKSLSTNSSVPQAKLRIRDPMRNPSGLERSFHRVGSNLLPKFIPKSGRSLLAQAPHTKSRLLPLFIPKSELFLPKPLIPKSDLLPKFIPKIRSLLAQAHTQNQVTSCPSSYPNLIFCTSSYPNFLAKSGMEHWQSSGQEIICEFLLVEKFVSLKFSSNRGDFL